MEQSGSDLSTELERTLAAEPVANHPGIFGQLISELSAVLEVED